MTKGTTIRRDPRTAERAAIAQQALAASSNPTALPQRQLEVLRRRANGDTLEAIGNDLGCGRERIRQLESDALQRLRAIARARAIRE